ncbi:MAG: 50S ribosome-binding GTPase [Candidatus Lokiarchaeota archaeon]|nr:50S ribosome-binding GTPase [Candidatus Lokiarchaeota archaeon]
MSEIDKEQKIKDFFKSNVIINELEEVLGFRPDTLIGVDNVSAEALKEHRIKSIQDLANLKVESPPEIRSIPEPIVIKWIKIAKVLEKAVTAQLKAQKKLLMIGLDNGGKTSILAVLEDKFSIIKDLMPTRGVQREKLDFFGYPIISWDLGGQVQYREKMYLTKPEIYFGEVDLILYVIDSQDVDRFSESANYFKQVLKVLDELKEYPPIVIVLNKSDQDIRRTLQWQKNIDSVKSKFNAVIDEFDKFKLDYYDTSIFQRPTIMQMFSAALMKVSETSEIVEHILEDFSTQIGGRAISIISMDGLIFGSYTKNTTDESLINNTALLLQTLSNFHHSIGLIRERTMVLELPLNGIAIRGVKLFEYSDLQIPVYLWLLSEKPELLDGKLDYFREQLLPLINMFV